MVNMARYQRLSYDSTCMWNQIDKNSIGPQVEAAGSLQASRSSLLQVILRALRKSSDLFYHDDDQYFRAQNACIRTAFSPQMPIL